MNPKSEHPTKMTPTPSPGHYLVHIPKAEQAAYALARYGIKDLSALPDNWNPSSHHTCGRPITPQWGEPDLCEQYTTPDGVWIVEERDEGYVDPGTPTYERSPEGDMYINTTPPQLSIPPKMESPPKTESERVFDMAYDSFFGPEKPKKGKKTTNINRSEMWRFVQHLGVVKHVLQKRSDYRVAKSGIHSSLFRRPRGSMPGCRCPTENCFCLDKKDHPLHKTATAHYKKEANAARHKYRQVLQKYEVEDIKGLGISDDEALDAEEEVLARAHFERCDEF